MKRFARKAVLAGVLVSVWSTGSMASASADVAQPQRVHLLFLSHDGEEAPTRAVAVGPITDHGTETQVREGRNEEGPYGRLTLHLTRGTVSGTWAEWNAQQNFDAQACVARPTAEGTIEITGGTGGYVGATGTLAVRRHGVIVGARGQSGECLGPGSGVPPKLVVMRVDAVGTAAIPA